MNAIEEKINSDLNELYENFEDVKINSSNEAEIVFESGKTIVKSEIEENSKTHQILEIYEDIQ